MLEITKEKDNDKKTLFGIIQECNSKGISVTIKPSFEELYVDIKLSKISDTGYSGNIQRTLSREEQVEFVCVYYIKDMMKKILNYRIKSK